MRMGSGKKKKPILLIIVAVIVVAAIVAVLGFNMAGAPVDSNDESKISVVIDEGSSTEDIARILNEKGLISSVGIFKFKSKLGGYDGSYQPGVYSLSVSQPMEDIMAVIASGKSDIVRFTIPEGYSTEQTVQVLVNAQLVTKKEFMDEIQNGKFDYKFLKDAPDDKTRLEGFMYPDTYEVYRNGTAHDIIDRMLSRFDELFTDEYYDRAKELNMNVRDIVTIASLIEWETKIADEREKVAGVIYNRLEKNMKLQIDAAIQYILDEPKEHLLYSDLEVDSPYNTYRNYGLPPGPICSPRIDCIHAALNPAQNDYIYYVMAPELDGTHNFSVSASEFEKNKAAYKDAIGDK